MAKRPRLREVPSDAFDAMRRDWQGIVTLAFLHRPHPPQVRFVQLIGRKMRMRPHLFQLLLMAPTPRASPSRHN